MPIIGAFSEILRDKTMQWTLTFSTPWIKINNIIIDGKDWTWINCTTQ